MKFTISFKNPDAESFMPYTKECIGGDDFTQTEANLDVFRKFTRWSEVVEIEFDSETMTAKVLQQNQV